MFVLYVAMESVRVYFSPNDPPFGALGSSVVGSGMSCYFWWLKCWLASCLSCRGGIRREEEEDVLPNEYIFAERYYDRDN